MVCSLFTTLASGANPVDHVVNQRYGGTGDLFGLHGVWLWSAHVGTLITAGLLTVLVLWWAANKIKTGPESQGNDRYLTTNPFAHMIEVICVFLRDGMVRPMMGARTDSFMAFLWTIFFILLFNNLMGLTPIADVLHIADHFAGGHYLTGLLGATATQ